MTQQVINPTGGTSTADGIRIYIGSNSQVQVVGWSDLVGAPGVYSQMYSPLGRPTSGTMYNSVVLRIEPAGGGTARIYADNNNGISGSALFTQTAQSAVVTGLGTSADPYTVVTTLNPPGADSGITVTLTDTYIFPDPYFSRAIDLTGLPAGDQVKLYWYIDTYLAGGDNGFGTSQTSASNTTGIPDFVGVTKPGVLQGIQAAAGMPLWDHYFSGSYSLPSSTYIPSATGDLPDIIDSSSIYQDNGIAVQWNVPLGQTAFSVRTGQTYSNSAMVSGAFDPDTINVGGGSVLHFDFQNFDTGAMVMSTGAAYSIPAGVALVSNTPAGNTCPGAGVSVASGQITFSGISLQPATNPGTPYICTISFNVTSNVIGTHIGTITPNTNITVGVSGAEMLTVMGVTPSGTAPIPTQGLWWLLSMVAGLAAIAAVKRRATAC